MYNVLLIKQYENIIEFITGETNSNSLIETNNIIFLEKYLKIIKKVYRILIIIKKHKKDAAY